MEDGEGEGGADGEGGGRLRGRTDRGEGGGTYGCILFGFLVWMKRANICAAHPRTGHVFVEENHVVGHLQKKGVLSQSLIYIPRLHAGLASKVLT